MHDRALAKRRTPLAFRLSSHVRGSGLVGPYFSSESPDGAPASPKITIAISRNRRRYFQGISSLHVAPATLLSKTKTDAKELSAIVTSHFFSRSLISAKTAPGIEAKQ